MITFLVLHFIGGAVLGGWFRFAALMPAFAFVMIEAIVATIVPLFAPWYVILVAGVVTLQLGYAAAAILMRPRRSAQLSPVRPRVSPQE